MLDDPQIGDLVRAKSNDLGIVIKYKPKQPIGASWVPERFVVWWLSDDKKTTEFVEDCRYYGDIEIVSSASKESREKRN